MKTVVSRWQGAVLVCGKCSKRLGGGFGAKRKTRLAKLLRGHFGKGRKATLGVIETKCLGVCPKDAVMLVDTRRPRAWQAVPSGSDVGLLAASLEGEGQGLARPPTSA